jgi:hypothetical protein
LEAVEVLVAASAEPVLVAVMVTGLFPNGGSIGHSCATAHAGNVAGDTQDTVVVPPKEQVSETVLSLSMNLLITLLCEVCLHAKVVVSAVRKALPTVMVKPPE